MTSLMASCTLWEMKTDQQASTRCRLVAETVIVIPTALQDCDALTASLVKQTLSLDALEHWLSTPLTTVVRYLFFNESSF